MKIKNTLSKSFLFSGINQDLLGEIISRSPPKAISYKRGELVYSSTNEESLVGFVLSGRCEIRLDRNSGAKTVLNVLGESDTFGILSVYSSEEFPTRIYATKNSEILFFTADQIRSFVNENSQISANLIRFLSNRISFLNRKIATFSCPSVEDRLATFLLSQRERLGSDEFPFNAQKTAEEINAGRASIYRAISSLEEANLISLINKKIYIKDLKGLERITKWKN